MAGCRPLNGDEIESIKKKFESSRNKLLFVLGIKTGFRITELLSLKISDVFENGNVLEKIKVTRRNMKAKISSREVVLHDEVRELIKEYLTSLGQFSDDTPLFKSTASNKAICRKHAWLILKEAYAEAGANGSTGAHSLRKSFAQNVYEKSGHDILLLQKALGHTSLQNTVKYLDIEQSEVDAIIKKC